MLPISVLIGYEQNSIKSLINNMLRHKIAFEYCLTLKPDSSASSSLLRNNSFASPFPLNLESTESILTSKILSTLYFVNKSSCLLTLFSRPKIRWYGTLSIDSISLSASSMSPRLQTPFRATPAIWKMQIVKDIKEFRTALCRHQRRTRGKN